MDTFSGHTLCNSCTSGTNTLLANFLCRDFGGWENDGVAISQLASHQCGTRLDSMCQVHQLNGRVKIRLNSHRWQHYRDLVHISITYTLIDLPQTICLGIKKNAGWGVWWDQSDCHFQFQGFASGGKVQFSSGLEGFPLNAEPEPCIRFGKPPNLEPESVFRFKHVWT